MSAACPCWLDSIVYNFPRHRLPALSFRIAEPLSFTHTYLIPEENFSGNKIVFVCSPVSFQFLTARWCRSLGPFFLSCDLSGQKIRHPFDTYRASPVSELLLFLCVFPAQNSILGVCSQRLAIGFLGIPASAILSGQDTGSRSTCVGLTPCTSSLPTPIFRPWAQTWPLIGIGTLIPPLSLTAID